MDAIFYDVTHTKVPGLSPNIHVGLERGFAYETATHFVHFYARRKGWGGPEPNLCVVGPSSGKLTDWLTQYFGAINFNTCDIPVGVSYDGIWRPGLYYSSDIYQALNTTEPKRKLTEQALRVLLEKLDDIFLYIEPDSTSFGAYSHKLRELLILACTEVENLLMYFIDKARHRPLNGSMYTTKDYVKLKDPLFLDEFQCTFKGHSSMPPIRPFDGWDALYPTKTLAWYDAYNKTKHNRIMYFSDANLHNVIQAVMANIILYIVMFGPFLLLEESGHFNSIVNQYFKFELINTNEKKHYVPLINTGGITRSDTFYFSPYKTKLMLPFTIDALKL